MITDSIHIYHIYRILSVQLLTEVELAVEVEKYTAVRCQQGAHFSCHYEAHGVTVMVNLNHSDILYEFLSSHPQQHSNSLNSSDTGSTFCQT